MTDLIVGMGEIGSALKQLLEMRGFPCDSYDIKNPTQLTPPYDFIHICIPFNDEFEDIVSIYKESGKVIIHSTVKPGTSAELGVIYSPVRGVHASMLEDLMYYTKYYSGAYNEDFEKRFIKTKNVPYSGQLEDTKILVDTTYYGWLIAYRKYVDNKYNVYWDFAEEIHEKLGNRPIMYNDNKPIGGHCVVQNLDLLDEPLFKELIK